MATLAAPEPEVVTLRHGVYMISVDDAHRWLLFERRSVAGRTIHDFDWQKVLTVERTRENPMFYALTFHETNERYLRQARSARQVLQDFMDQKEREFTYMVLGV